MSPVTVSRRGRGRWTVHPTESITDLRLNWAERAGAGEPGQAADVSAIDVLTGMS